MTKETNQVKMFGVLPSQDADPIIVRMAPEAAGGDMIEANQVRQIGILPSEGADPILVEVTNFDAKARAAINDIFGSDGKADADIDLDSHNLLGVNGIVMKATGTIGESAGQQLIFEDNLLYIKHPSSDTLLIFDTYADNKGIYNIFREHGAKRWTWGKVWNTDDYFVERWTGAAGSEVNRGIPFRILSTDGSVDIPLHNPAGPGLKLAGNIISYDIDDSGGAGFKVLRVPN